MSTSTISGSKSKVESDLAKDDRRRRINHYVSKADITESIVTGKRVTALCGETFVATAQGNGSAAAPFRGRTVICQPCKSIHYKLPAGGH